MAFKRILKSKIQRLALKHLSVEEIASLVAEKAPDQDVSGGPLASPSMRSQYKAVWNQLSTDEANATAHVIGPVDEAAIRAAALETLEKLETTVGVRPDDSTLEIGCGIGRVGQALASRCRRWTGCDVSSNMLAFARHRLAEFDNVELLEVSGYDLGPVPSSSQELVYCTVVFMHLEEWDRYNYIVEAFRILKPGGRLFVDNVSLSTDEGWQVFETHSKIAPDDRPAHMTKCSTTDELEAYLSRAGFLEIRSRNRTAWAECWGQKPSGG